MKLIKKVFVILLVLIIISIIFIGLIGFGYYYNTIHENSLSNRVLEITSKEHYTPFDKLPTNYVNAVIAVEDHRYYSHSAVDFIGIARAMYTNIRKKEFSEGGSTISQQVSKNVIFNQEQTLLRKVGELFGAFDLEKNYSKDEIFALYVNSSYFGDGYYCIYDASMGYFNKEPSNLNLDEASMLAGIPNAPSAYSPTVNLTLAKKRQAHVLSRMVEYGYITQAQKDEITN